ncbi:IS5 family transposase [Dokdonella fugitiva]|uniref:IS5 family transposase n=1 Tax=Dokdonella fugitiva TaxID=328517 RepID=UPI0015F9B96C|nr:IS5 family transposase [Dokdonella fugitiva]
MDQLTFGDADFAGKGKQTRKERFLAEMEQVVPWPVLERLIEPVYPASGNGRRPYPLQTMLRVHLMQNWFSLSDPGMEDALYDMPALRQFARLSSLASIPDETTILNFRRRIEEYGLAPEILSRVNRHLARKGLVVKHGTMVDATIIDAPSSTKNADRERDPEMRQTKKGQQYYFGMKAHIGADVESGLVHTVVTTAANESDVAQIQELLHGKEHRVHGDAGYVGAQAYVKRAKKIEWKIARRRSQVEKIRNARERARVMREERRKAQVRAYVEHPFRVVKCVFGYVKTRFKGLTKNTTQIVTLFALANLYAVRKHLLSKTGQLRPQLG